MSQPKLQGLFPLETPEQSVRRWREEEANGLESIRRAVNRLRDMAESIVVQADEVLSAEDEANPRELLKLLEVVRDLAIPTRLLIAERCLGGANVERTG